jgi:serine/threonine protein kinase/Tol biopolymer transport system component
MRRTSGARIGGYEVLSLIGAGGMGEVYRAKDTKLNRDVALKILPESFALDADRVARFKREAQVLASLNHPNIGAIYGFEESNGTQALVLELVDGPTLADRIAQGPIPLDEALPIAKQIAEALEAAHEQGIIHRDLKPANIKLRPDGTVKVLDFGLAKLAETTAQNSGTALANSPTITSRAMMTGVGMLLGTAPYMAPEQAKGKPADKRSDVWAFGCVLFEMLTGNRAFDGEDVSETLAAILTKEPDWRPVPVTAQRVLRTCIEKESARRWRSPVDAVIALEHDWRDREGVARPGRSRLTLLVPAITLVVAVIMAAVMALRPSSEPLKHSIRLNVDLGADVVATGASNFALSPAGDRFVFVSQGRLFIRRLDEEQPTELAGTLGATGPFFSPDGRWIAFRGNGKLRKVSVDGGQVIPLVDTASLFTGGSWADDGSIVVPLGTRTPLVRVSEDGRTTTPLTSLEPPDASHRHPHVLPGSNAVLFSAAASIEPSASSTLKVASVKSGAQQVLLGSASSGRFVPIAGRRGYLLYFSRGRMFAAPFDSEQLKMVGTAVPVLDDVAVTELGDAIFDVVPSGTAVFRRASAAGRPILTSIHADGQSERLNVPAGRWPVLSPDGTKLALVVDSDVWVFELAGNSAATRLTFERQLDAGGGTGLVWTPDGRYILFGGADGTTYVRSDGGAKPTVLIEQGPLPASFNRDGVRLALRQLAANGASDISVVDVTIDERGISAGKIEPYLATPYSELGATFSPDGRWVAYFSNESGSYQVQVRAFPDNGGRWQIVSPTGGYFPVWSRTRPELLFHTEDGRVMVVTYDTSKSVFSASKPRMWTDKRLSGLPTNRLFDIHPEGSRIITFVSSDVAATTSERQVTFLFNFIDELRRRVPLPD